MKDDSIRIRMDSKLKESFRKQCDGRPMTLVLIQFIEEYSKDKGGENNEPVPSK